MRTGPTASGDAAAEVLFRLAASFPGVVAEGWWRRARRDRAIHEFSGWIEIFCRCDPQVAQQRMRQRAVADRHPIHRDVINAALLDEAGAVAASVTPLHLGSALIEADTTQPFEGSAALAAIRAAMDGDEAR